MVFALVLLTILAFLAIDWAMRREERKLNEIDKSDKSPIFLSPDKALLPVGNEVKRLYHLSHTWVIPSDQGYLLVGYDDFISILFTDQVKLNNLPLVGSHITQGTRIWDVQSGDHALTQLAPLSGQVVGINPACKMSLPLPSAQVEKSWILKIKAASLDNEGNNLLPYTQASLLNTKLRDDLLQHAQQEHFLNDGGQIDPEYIKKMSAQEWTELVQKFFPYHQNLK